MKDASVAVNLTHSQINNLIEFLELEFLPSIRKDDAADNMEYLVDMCDAYKELRRALMRVGG